MAEKINILIGYVTEFSRGGVNFYIKNVIQSLNAEKVSIDILTNVVTDELKKDAEFLGVNILTTDRLTRPYARYQQTKKIVQKKKYDIVYFNISEAFNCICNLAVKKYSDAVIITHSHNSSNDDSNRIKRFVARTMNAICRPVVRKNSDYYYACSEIAGEWLFGKKITNNEKFRIIRNTVDVNKFKFDQEKRKVIKTKYKIADNTLVIGFVGNLLYQKNPLFLIDIFAAIEKKHSQSFLFILGDGEMKNDITSKTKQLKLEDKICLTGNVSNVNEYMSAFDCFLLPSFFEGLPIVGVEAQVNGLECFFANTITEEVSISDKTNFIPLESGAEAWADMILQNVNVKSRTETIYKNIMYDREEQKKEFENIFIYKKYI